MAKYNRKDWHEGMLVTHQDFIDTDSFHVEQQNTIRRLQVMPCYGLLSESAFNEDDASKQFITPAGQLIEFDEQDVEYTGNIPPCISINSHKDLLQKFDEIKQKTAEIIIEIKEQEKYKPILLPFSLLELELKNYSTFETPMDLFLTVKKNALVLKSNIIETLEKTEVLLNETYCHTEIDKMISLLLDALCEIEQIVKKPIVAGPPKIKIAAD
ncbi:MAG: hypothetical protein FWD02_06155 [Bacteroidales bacterium]|nr:hypothetical protein [Bacteroidales bacterium]